MFYEFKFGYKYYLFTTLIFLIEEVEKPHFTEEKRYSTRYLQQNVKENPNSQDNSLDERTPQFTFRQVM